MYVSAGTRYANSLSAHNWNLMEILLASTLFLMDQSDHKLVQDDKILLQVGCHV